MNTRRIRYHLKKKKKKLIFKYYKFKNTIIFLFYSFRSETLTVDNFVDAFFYKVILSLVGVWVSILGLFFFFFTLPLSSGITSVPTEEKKTYLINGNYAKIDICFFFCFAVHALLVDFDFKRNHFDTIYSIVTFKRDTACNAERIRKTTCFFFFFYS